MMSIYSIQTIIFGQIVRRECLGKRQIQSMPQRIHLFRIQFIIIGFGICLRIPAKYTIKFINLVIILYDCESQLIIIMDLSKYSSERLMQANEVQLKAILQQYKKDKLPFWKFGLFVAYNAVALTGMYTYGVKLRGARVQPSHQYRHKFSIGNLFKKGVTHSLIMIAAYVGGLTLICSNTISFSLLKKLTEIQSTYHSFGLKFDPNYQDHLLFSRMRKFDISESLIEQIKAELKQQKMKLIESGGLLPMTIKKIEQAQKLYQNRQKEIR